MSEWLLRKLRILARYAAGPPPCARCGASANWALMCPPCESAFLAALGAAGVAALNEALLDAELSRIVHRVAA
jgi:hypothetical protein